MDTSTFRILDTLSSSIGDPLSINQLTERIRKTHGTAYYANIYQKLQDLKDQDLLTLDPIGRSSSIKLNFRNYLLIDALAEMELRKKRNFLERKRNLLPLLIEMNTAFNDADFIKTIAATFPEKNLKLNRIELLFLIAQTPNHHKRTIEICEEMQRLQNKHNIKTDSLILNKHDFQQFITTDEINPARESLGEKIILSGPQAFYGQIKDIAENTEIKVLREETKPLKIPNADLTYNLNRFGYQEFGRPMTQGRNISIEYVVTTLLLQDDTRLQEAAPVILAKNTFNSNVLAFLSKKFDTNARLIGIMKILREFKPTTETNETIDLLNTFGSKEIPTDKKDVLSKLKLFNAL
jgi:hypothetical protein